MLAVNLFHMRGGKMVDRREFFWEDLPEITTEHVGTTAPGCPGEQSSPGADSSTEAEQGSRASLGMDSRGRLSPHDPGQSDDSFSPGEFFSALLKQLYVRQPYV